MNTQNNNAATLRNFIESRPGFNPANYYGNPKAYSRDAYTARTQKRHALELLDLAERVGVEFADTTPQALRGRVYLEGGKLEHICAAYYPTEYRAQAARFIAAHIREHLYAMGRNPAKDSAVDTLSRGAREYI